MVYNRQTRSEAHYFVTGPSAPRDDRVLHSGRDSIRTQWFFDEVERAMLDRFDCHRNVARSRNHENGHGIFLGIQILENLESRSAGKVHIE